MASIPYLSLLLPCVPSPLPVLSQSCTVSPSAFAPIPFHITSQGQPRKRTWQHKSAPPDGNGSWLATRCACSADESAGEGPEAKDPLSFDVELDKFLEDEELFKDLNAAAERVAAARRELDALERREKNAAKWEAQMKSLDAADSAVAERQREFFAAEADVEAAELALVKARAGTSVWDLTRKWEVEGIDEDKERIESGKAATVSAFVGTLASLPWSVTVVEDIGVELMVRAGLVFASCALFGVTYRYVVRQDLGNTELKAGCAAAFALVRGLGQIDAAKVLSGFPEGALQKLFQACLFTGESLVIFSFAAVGLDYCLREGFLSPFPSRKA